LPALIEIGYQNSRELESIVKLEESIGETTRSAKSAGYKLNEYLNPPTTNADNDQPLSDPKVTVSSVKEVDQQPADPQTISIASQKN
jgi:hypothetical protein